MQRLLKLRRSWVAELGCGRSASRRGDEVLGVRHRRLQKTARRPVFREEGLHFLSKLIIALAGVRQECRALRFFAFQGRRQERVDSLPTLRVHRPPSVQVDVYTRGVFSNTLVGLPFGPSELKKRSCAGHRSPAGVASSVNLSSISDLNLPLDANEAYCSHAAKRAGCAWNHASPRWPCTSTLRRTKSACTAAFYASSEPGDEEPPARAATSPCYEAAVAGWRLCQSVACSYAWAMRRTAASPPRGPVICIPIGRPACVKPQGTEIAGSPSTLNGLVLCSIEISFVRSVFMSPSRSAMANGGTGAVGVIKRSTLSNALEMERRI